jgi:hypothetical protein
MAKNDTAITIAVPHRNGFAGLAFVVDMLRLG